MTTTHVLALCPDIRDGLEDLVGLPHSEFSDLILEVANYSFTYTNIYIYYLFVCLFLQREWG